VIHSQKISGVSEGPQRSNYRAVVDPEACVACGVCIERCPVEAITEDEDDDNKSRVERAKCIGCGVCVIGCPTDAIELEPVSAEEWFHTPSSMAEWEEMRLEYLAALK
jgi:NAD-dependent dihydropyrimidine dehydrogenase PreA subunit